MLTAGASGPAVPLAAIRESQIVGLMTTSNSGSPVAARIAAFVLDTRLADVPAADLVAIEQSTFDLIGVLLAGRTSPHAQAVERYVRSEGGRAECTVIGAGFRAPAPLAALSNATAAHADDFDDMGGYGHPSAPLLPALFAAAELKGGVSGAEILAAYAVGFDVGAAFCTLGHYDQYTRCFHSTPVFGTFAGVCAVARLLELSPEKTAAAISIAASFAAGLGRNSGTMVKPLHAGEAASNAVLSALLADEGLNPVDDVFEGRGGVWESFFATPKDAMNGIVASLGQPFRAAKSLYIKRFPCCGSNQSALNGVLDVIADNGIERADIASVIVRNMGETSPVLRYPRPAYGLNGKFSIQFTVGSLLLKGKLGIDEFDDACTADPAVIESLNRVTAEILPRWDHRNAAKGAGNPVTVILKDGQQLEGFARRTTMPGSPQQPLAESELVAKFVDNASRSVAREGDVDDLVTTWRTLGKIDDIRYALKQTAG
jgi:2-methylcitrate dehydratase PrpD